MKQSTLTRPAKRRHSDLERGKLRAGTAFILPALILCMVFMVYPLFEVIRYSLTDWNGIAQDYNYVGLSNYGEITKIDGFKDMMIFLALGGLYAATSLWLLMSYEFIPSGMATTIHFLYPQNPYNTLHHKK